MEKHVELKPSNIKTRPLGAKGFNLMIAKDCKESVYKWTERPTEVVRRNKQTV